MNIKLIAVIIYELLIYVNFVIFIIKYIMNRNKK